MNNKNILIIRFGAIGDSIVVSPIIKHLSRLGYKIYLNTSETGMQVFENNPYVYQFIPYKTDSVPMNELREYWNGIKLKYNISKAFNLTESIELKLALHPSHPNYNLTKQEREKRFNRNYYEYSYELCGLDHKNVQLYGDLYFTDDERDFIISFLRTHTNKNTKKILLPLSGSGINKVYPWWHRIFSNLYKRKHHKDFKLFVIGDKVCQLMEDTLSNKYTVKLSNKLSIRQCMLLCSYMDLVVSTDTGMLHASGIFDNVTKIALLGHSTPENITKHFRGKVINICSTVPCAPCFRLIYDSQIQCPRYEPLGVGCLCMTGLWDYTTGKFKSGIDPMLVQSTIENELWMK